jgi:hypothetical protein
MIEAFVYAIGTYVEYTEVLLNLPLCMPAQHFTFKAIDYKRNVYFNPSIY